eukprot:scaffold223402_cov28-Tisochrysis_lutea.AAC.2
MQRQDQPVRRYEPYWSHSAAPRAILHRENGLARHSHPAGLVGSFRQLDQPVRRSWAGGCDQVAPIDDPPKEGDFAHRSCLSGLAASVRFQDQLAHQCGQHFV